MSFYLLQSVRVKIIIANCDLLVHSPHIIDGLKTIEVIANIHNGSDTQTSFQFSLAELGAFKFAPITSVDVERSFSRYKNILRPNRRRFTFDNLKKYMIVNCFVDNEVDSNE